MESSFCFKDTSLYTEVAPKQPDKVRARVAAADDNISEMNANARKIQYECDELALARDLAQISNLYKEMMKTQEAARQERIVHLRGQNIIGASIVSEFMSSSLAVHSGTPKDVIALTDRVRD